jgi:hypothetical protein
MLIFALRFTEMWCDSVAQLVEQYTFNVWVLGSSPNGITGSRLAIQDGFFFSCTCLLVLFYIFMFF